MLVFIIRIITKKKIKLYLIKNLSIFSLHLKDSIDFITHFVSTHTESYDQHPL